MHLIYAHLPHRTAGHGIDCIIDASSLSADAFFPLSDLCLHLPLLVSHVGPNLAYVVVSLLLVACTRLFELLRVVPPLSWPILFSRSHSRQPREDSSAGELSVWYMSFCGTLFTASPSVRSTFLLCLQRETPLNQIHTLTLSPLSTN